MSPEQQNFSPHAPTERPTTAVTLPIEKFTDIEAAETEAKRESLARFIAEQGSYDAILNTFAQRENQGMLAEQIDRLKSEHSEGRLRDAREHLSPHDWEMLTILELFDTATFEHVLRTYESLHEKLSSHQPIGILLRERLAQDGISAWDLELAALLHDMGKIAMIPKQYILQNSLKDEEWRALFEQSCQENYSPEIAAQMTRDLEDRLAANGRLREKDVVPLTIGLSPADRERAEAAGIDTNLPLGKVMEAHQDISADIAGRYHAGSPLLELVKNHHERSDGTGAQAMRSTINLLRTADIYDAYHNKRYYKNEQSLIDTLAFLVDECKYGFIDRELAQAWIRSDLQKIDTAQYEASLHENPTLPFNGNTDKKEYLKVRAFLDETFRFPLAA